MIIIDYQGVKIQKLHHDTIRLHGSRVVYFDPFKIEKTTNDADVIFISHPHYDHCSVEDVEKVANMNTIIVCVPDCMSKFSGMNIKQVVPVEPNKVYDVNGVKIATIPAYNINKFCSPGMPFHPQEQEWVGYIVLIDGKKFYHSGDTDATPEMLALKNIDVAFVPVSGTYVMTAEEAAKAVNQFQPKLAIPIHYGAIVGAKSDAEKFKGLCSVKVEVLE